MKRALFLPKKESHLPAIVKIDWYLLNIEWLNNVTSGDYQIYYTGQYK